MSKGEDWFRNSKWDKKAQDEFRQGIERSRTVSSKRHKSYVKALSLGDSGDPPRIRAAIDLLHQVIKAWPEEWQYSAELWALGRWHRALGERGDAIRCFQESLSLERAKKSGHTTCWVDYLSLIVEDRIADLYPDARRILEEHERDDSWPEHQFVLLAATSVLAWEDGNHATAHRHAEAALEQAGRKTSGWANHPSLGLVKGREALVAALDQIVADPKAKAARANAVDPSPLADVAIKDDADALERKLLVQLGELGVRAKSVWDLIYRAPKSYELALPLLVRFLGTIPSSTDYRRLREGVVRSLNVPSLAKLPGAPEALIASYRATDDDHDRQVTVQVFAKVARKDHAGFVLQELQDERNEHSRGYFMPLLKRLVPERAEPVLLKLLASKHWSLDPEMIVQELGYCGTSAALPALTPHLKGINAGMVKTTRRAIDRIRARQKKA